MKKILFVLVFLFLCASRTQGACSGGSPTWTAASASNTDITACVTVASSGDTIIAPASAGVAYSSAVNIPAAKCLTITGQGAVTITNSGAAFIVNNSATCESRVTGFAFTGGSGNQPATNIVVNGGASCSRIDHNTFSHSGVNIYMEINSLNSSTGQSYPVLIDHNSFTGAGASEFVHVDGAGATNNIGWTTTVTPGGPNMVFIEYNTMTNSDSIAAETVASGVESYYGAQTVFRNNTMVASVQVDQHGTMGSVGARWWEAYDNFFQINGHNQCCVITMRGGSGVIFGNTDDGTNTHGGGNYINLYYEPAGTFTWPGPWQPGSGINGNAPNPHGQCGATNQAPAQIWGNGGDLGAANTGSATPSDVALNRDYFVSSSQPASIHWEEAVGDTCSTTYTYTPFTNPHPLDTGGAGPVSFSPTSLPFGSQNTGTSSSALTTTLSNTTAGTITYSAPTITGPNASDFYYSAASTCNFSAGGTLTTGASCTYAVVFSANAAPGAAETSTLTQTFTGGGTSPQTVSLTGTSTGSFIPSTRTVDWTHAGIPGGIPSAAWPICITIPPSGGADDSTTIQNALNSCAAGSVVLLTAGTYTLHRTTTPSPPGTVCVGKTDDFGFGVYEAGLCLTDKSIVLRGAGPNQTVLNYGDGANIISMGHTYFSSSLVVFTPITSSATKGATAITVGSLPSGVVVGSYIVVTQTNPTDTDGNPLVNTTGYTGTCSGCGNGLTSNQYQQIDHVTAIAGTTMTLERPLYMNYANSPAMFLLPNMQQNIGLENLRVVGTAASGTALEFKNVNMQSCARCWVHNVETDWAVDKSNIYLTDTYQTEISNDYAFQAFNHNSGADYSLLLEFRNSEDLIANNIIRLARHSTPESGGMGNAYIYNLMLNAYMGEAHNFLPETTMHAANPSFNLWEGNVMSNTEFGDFAHGSSNWDTFFRNYVNLTANNPDTNTPMTTGLIAVNTAYYSNYENIVGNVFGQYPSGCTATTYETDASTAKVNGVIWQLGYFDDGGGSTPNQALSNKVGSTLIRGGNWDCKSGTTVWASNVPSGFSSTVTSYMPSQTLPNSLVFSSAPGYFAATRATWPPIDVANSTIVNQLPAQICYNASGGPNTSLGGNFNPTTCYVSSVSLSPSSNSFGSLNVGSSSSPVTFTLTNGSGTTATGITPTTTGGNAGDFTIINSGAGSCSSIAAGASCVFTVTFTPTSTGSRSTTLSVAYSGGDGDSPQTAALSGTGTSSTTIGVIISGAARISGGAKIQ